MMSKLAILLSISRASRSSSSLPRPQRRLTLNSMSPSLKQMEYAVRGPVVQEADELSLRLANGESVEAGFEKIIYTNIGNPHSVGQKALTFPRQVMALTDLPREVGVDSPDASKLFPQDAIVRARGILDALGGHGTGAYSHSKGVRKIRQEVCSFIEKRDGYKADEEDIFLTNGASSGIGFILGALIDGNTKTDAVMVPIPQYPIYSAQLALLQANLAGYFLDEEKGWTASASELQRSLDDATAKGQEVKAFVLINPGNPTGQVLDYESLKVIIEFCAKNRLVLLADEVYQENVYDKSKKSFISCKKIASDLNLLSGDPSLPNLELVSFHSTSKGLIGECGRRGGYMELSNIDPDVKGEIYKLASSGLCSGIAGQVMTSLMVNEPAPGDESYEAHEGEKKAIYESLKRRAKLVVEGLNAIEGFSCQEAEGAMYCFPKVELPQKAIDAAKAENTTPDSMYAISLLRRTGICVVPASGFGQKEGRYGFRTTFLPPEEEMEEAVALFATHHKEFLNRFR